MWCESRSERDARIWSWELFWKSKGHRRWCASEIDEYTSTTTDCPCVPINNPMLGKRYLLSLCRFLSHVSVLFDLHCTVKYQLTLGEWIMNRKLNRNLGLMWIQTLAMLVFLYGFLPLKEPSDAKATIEDIPKEAQRYVSFEFFGLSMCAFLNAFFFSSILKLVIGCDAKWVKL